MRRNTTPKVVPRAVAGYTRKLKSGHRNFSVIMLIFFVRKQGRENIYGRTDRSGPSFGPESCKLKQERVIVHGYDNGPDQKSGPNLNTFYLACIRSTLYS